MANGNKQIHLLIPIQYLAQESAKAYCFKLTDGKKWIPKSLIKDWQTDKDNADFWIPQWCVEQNDLECFIDTSFEPSLF